MNSSIILPRALTAFAVVSILGWTSYLWLYMPEVSRGDFFLAMMRVSDAFKDGRLLYAMSWPVHILGGHIIFYERVIQLFNYYVLDYSPLFVKMVAVFAWALVGVGFYKVILRSELGNAAKLACLAIFVLITFNPIPWEVLSWPDSNVPYLSSLIVLLFSAGAFVRLLRNDDHRSVALPLTGLSVLVIIGSGVGWSIIPVIVWLLILETVFNRDYRYLPAVAGVSLFAIAFAYVLVAFFPNVLRLSLVTASLKNLDLVQLFSYFFALFGTVLGQNERPINVWVGAVVFTVSAVIYAIYKLRNKEPSEPELLFLFGVLSLFLVSLGRWKLNLERPTATLSTYYHIFTLPAYYGAILMLARLMPSKPGALVLAGVFAVIGGSYLSKMPFFHRNFKSQAESYMQMLPAVSGWRMTEALRLIGENFHNQTIFFEFLPALNQEGKYPSLAARFHPYQSSRIERPVPTANMHSCNEAYRNLEVFEVSKDERGRYTQGEPQRPFYRFVGAARDSRDCDRSGVSVSLVNENGIVNCKSWTTPNVYWHFRSEKHNTILRSPYGFDFSCPMEEGNFYLVTQDKTGQVIEAVKVN